MLSDAYFLAKLRFDTAENEPAKNLQNFIFLHAHFANFAPPRVISTALSTFSVHASIEEIWASAALLELEFIGAGS